MSVDNAVRYPYGFALTRFSGRRAGPRPEPKRASLTGYPVFRVTPLRESARSANPKSTLTRKARSLRTGAPPRAAAFSAARLTRKGPDRRQRASEEQRQCARR